MKLKDLHDIELDILLPLLRNYGINSFTTNGVSITFDKSVAPASSYNSDFGDESFKLPCGHELWDSNDEGLCLHGCSPEIKKEDNN